ncbi:MAG: MotA/TolQ/ExbB proton channel family protein [Candidatus Thiosymbion ectosymbiont of Robbea hypermnestra]|nr:MotA/TolQ/ExbB proton channel family protein [Candidatus Thiosymbion ectosymbiont of Robbea hypermnestra]
MNNLWEKPDRLLVLPLFLILGGLFIGLLSALLPAGGPAAVLLLDHHALPPPNYPFAYPLTVQNLTHLLLFLGFGELYCRWRIAEREQSMVREQLLPEEYQVVLQSHDLPPIRARVAARHDGEHGFLPSLIDLCILQFQASRSVDQTVSVLNSSLELIAHRLDLRYAVLRYIVWVIPTIGFMGTVIGISLAMGLIDPGATEQPLGEIAQSLGVAFYTTLVALAESAILVLLLNLVQAREETALNQAGNYTLTNLINRLYAGA